MRRDHFTVQTENLDPAGTDSPTLDIEYEGPEETLTEQLTTPAKELIKASDIDAAYRFQADPDEEEATGVFSLTHRVTGEFLLEFNVEGQAVLDLVRAAREANEEEASYRIAINRAEGTPIVYCLDALLVYDSEGNLLRQQSLIPSGVEL